MPIKKRIHTIIVFNAKSTLLEVGKGVKHRSMANRARGIAIRFAIMVQSTSRVAVPKTAICNDGSRWEL